MTKDEKLIKFKDFLLKEKQIIKWNINLVEESIQYKVNPWRNKWALIIDIWCCDVKGFDISNINLNKLDYLYHELEKIFND